MDEDLTKMSIEALEQYEHFIEYLRGLVSKTMAEGFTDPQARAIVAYMFGYRVPPENDDVA